MQRIFDQTRSYVSSAWSRALGRSASLNHRTLAWGGLALAAVILLSANLVSAVSLRGWKADLTEDRLYTISDGTRTILRTVDEPIKVRVYFWRNRGGPPPSHAHYFDRVRTLLEQYRDISGGKL